MSQIQKQKLSPLKTTLNLTEKNRTLNSDPTSTLESVRKLKPLQPGLFEIYGRKLKLERKSYFLFTNKNKVRLVFLYIVESSIFDKFIMFCILVNSVMLAMNDYSGKMEERNRIFDLVGKLFSGLFILEFAMKSIAYGFVVHKNSYLRDSWNIIDFLIVLSGIAEFFTVGVNLKSLRTIRVLRPLKTISNLPSMRKLVKTLFYSLPELWNVLIFLFFIFAVFSIMGLQQFQGAFYTFCRQTEKPVNATYWPISLEHGKRTCSKSGQGIYSCPDNQVCGSVFDYDLESDEVKYNPTIQYGIHNFDTFPTALMTVFQIITKDSWTVVLYNLRDSEQTALSTAYCCLLITVGSFFLLNLILAVIMEKFTKVQQFEFEEKAGQQDSIWSSGSEDELSEDESEEEELEEEKVKESEQLDQSEASLDDRNSQISKSTHNLVETPQFSLSPTKKQVLPIRGIIKQNTFSPTKRGRQRINSDSSSVSNSLEEIKEEEREEAKEDGRISQAIRSSYPNMPSIGNLYSIQAQRTSLEEFKETARPSDRQFTTEEDIDPETQRMPLMLVQQENQVSQPFNLNPIKIINQQQSKKSTASAKKKSTDSGKKKSSTRKSKFEPTWKKKEPKTPGVFAILQRKISLRNSHNIENDTQRTILGSVFNLEKSPKKTQFKRLRSARRKSQKSNSHLGSLETPLQSQKSVRFRNLARKSGQLLSSFSSSKGKQNELQNIALTQNQLKRKELEQEMKMIKNNLRVQYIKSKQKSKGDTLSIPKIKKEIKKQVNFNKRQSRDLAIIEPIRTNSKEIETIDFQMKIKDQLKQSKYQEEEQEKENKLAEQISPDLQKQFQEHQKVLERQKLQEDLAKNAALLRAYEVPLYLKCFYIQQNSFFQLFISLSIIANTIILAMDRLNIKKDEAQALELINLFFSIVFFIEMAVKMLGLGVQEYFRDRFNMFDAFIVLVSVVDFIYTSVFSFQSVGTGAVTAFRAFRLLRIFKLAKRWKKFQQLLETIGKSLQDISTFSVLLAIFIYTYTLIGMELFAYQIKFDQDDRPIKDLDIDGKFHLQNFNTFLESFYSVFTVLANDGWTAIYFDVYRVKGPSLGVTYFFSLLALGQFLLLNIFLAIMVSNFDEDSFNQEALKNQQGEQKISWKQQIKELLSLLFKKNQVNPEETVNQEEDEQFQDRALYLFGPESEIRWICTQWANSKIFYSFVIISILISSAQLAIESPLNDPDSLKSYILEKMEVTTSCIFMAEAVFKIVKEGFVINGEKSYLKQLQNQVDFLIVILSIISLSSDYDIAAIKILRLFRVLKPIRIISRSNGLKLSIASLISSIPAIINTMIICFLFYLIFGIIGVNLFMGAKFDCFYQKIEESKDFKLEHKWDCLNAGGYWKNDFYNYDNVKNSILTLFAMSTTVGWQLQMYQGIAFKKIDYLPVRNHNLPIGIFFVFFIIVASFFILNLFVGIVISNFNREKERIGKDFLLTEGQKKWVETKLMIIKAQPRILDQAPSNCLRAFCFHACKHPQFENTIYASILLNTIFLALSWRGQSDQVKNILEMINFFFNGLFTLEALMKIMAFGKQYFKEKWNVFDLTIVLGTWFGILLRIFLGVNLGPQTTVIRTFRVGRMFRLLKRNKSLKQIFQTFIISLPGLSNIGFLLILFLYIYSVLGVSLFANVKHSGQLTRQANFESTFMAMLTLLRISTGENWHLIMQALARKEDMDFECVTDPTFNDYKENDFRTVGCGDPVSTILFFVSFIMVVTLVFLNLFIAIILLSFEDIIQTDKQVFNQQMTDFYRLKWAMFDPDATGFIKITDFKKFMFELGEPLGWSRGYPLHQQDHFQSQMKLRTYDEGTRYFFTDILENLALLLVVRSEMERVEKAMGGESMLKAESKESIQGISEFNENQESQNQLKPTSRTKKGSSKRNSFIKSNLMIENLKESIIQSEATQEAAIVQKLHQEQNQKLNSLQKDPKLPKSRQLFQKQSLSNLLYMKNFQPKQVAQKKISRHESMKSSFMPKNEIKSFVDIKPVKEELIEDKLSQMSLKSVAVDENSDSCSEWQVPDRNSPAKKEEKKIQNFRVISQVVISRPPVETEESSKFENSLMDSDTEEEEENQYSRQQREIRQHMTSRMEILESSQDSQELQVQEEQEAASQNSQLERSPIRMKSKSRHILAIANEPEPNPSEHVKTLITEEGERDLEPEEVLVIEEEEEQEDDQEVSLSIAEMERQIKELQSQKESIVSDQSQNDSIQRVMNEVQL